MADRNRPSRVASITVGFPQSNIDKTGGDELLKTGLVYVRAMTIALWNAFGVGRWRAVREPAVREPLEHLPVDRLGGVGTAQAVWRDRRQFVGSLQAALLREFGLTLNLLRLSLPADLPADLPTDLPTQVLWLMGAAL